MLDRVDCIVLLGHIPVHKQYLIRKIGQIRDIMQEVVKIKNMSAKSQN